MRELNPLVQNMVEPQLAETVSYWPQTLGWKILFISLLLVVVYKAFQAIKQYRKNKYRRDALAELDTIKALVRTANVDKQAPLHQLNILLKQVACHAYQHNDLAKLHGQEWLIFLARHGEVHFDNELANKWQQALFNPLLMPEINQEHINELIALSACWIKTHQGETTC